MFRCDRPISKTRKNHKCYWCGEDIEKRSPAVRVSGVNEGFYSEVFHPECWRAEAVEYWNTYCHDTWRCFGESMRGAACERGGEASRFYDDKPVTLEEASFPHRFYELRLLSGDS